MVDYRLQKPNQNRVRIIVRGNLIQYPHEDATCNTNSGPWHCQNTWNIVVTTQDAKYDYADVKSFHLYTPMECFELMHMPIKVIPQSFIDE